ncbi:CDC27 family protein [Nitrosophilus alvini]|uniref:CDC27 family protein n=1 Tax=Nitrosophilus alvini TaxID=2714855 RepID=UPI00190AEF5D|nr:CDC27 family protein [Nitrosophilus alvini]
MHEIEELEKRWRKYRFKKMVPKLLFLAFVVSVAIFVTVDLSPFKISLKPEKSLVTESYKPKENLPANTVSEKSVSEKNVTAKVTPTYKKTEELNKTKQSPTKTVSIEKTEQNISVKITEEKNETEQKRLFLKPADDFIQHITISENTQNEKKKIEKKPVKKSVQKRKKEVQISKIDKIKIKKQPPSKTIGYIINKFERTKDPQLAVFLSKSYYKDGKYKEALSWAIKANEIDSSNEESWILFAKASVKLGRKNEAINALRAYLSRNDSSSVRIVLDQILSGEFK